jgi:hypothetical protein
VNGGFGTLPSAGNCGTTLCPTGTPTVQQTVGACGTLFC